MWRRGNCVNWLPPSSSELGETGQNLAEPHAVPAYKERYRCLRTLELATQSSHSLPSTWDTHLETSYYKTTSYSLKVAMGTFAKNSHCSGLEQHERSYPTPSKPLGS